jgi:DNA 3'-phosphatase
VPGTLKKLHEEGYDENMTPRLLEDQMLIYQLHSYLVAVVSNQGGISLKPDPKTVKSDQKRLADFKSKVSAVFTHLDIPVSVYAATARDQYRKPRTGMWEEMLDDYDLDAASSVDLDNSFFVGDAGGREALGSSVKDHSCVDRSVEPVQACHMKMYAKNNQRFRSKRRRIIPYPGGVLPARRAKTIYEKLRPHCIP